MPRRLPMPLGSADPLSPCKPLGGEKQLALWIKWKAESTGVSLPEFHVATATPHHNFKRGVATLYLKKRDGWYYGKETLESVETFAIPAHVIPCKRADLWHAAHQSNLSFDEIYSEGQGWRANAERAKKAQETAWKNERKRYAERSAASLAWLNSRVPSVAESES